MMVAVYLIGFAISLVLIAFSEKKRLPIFLLFSAIALLIPCLIAGLRSQTVGTDVMVYVKPLTRASIMADDLANYFNTYWYDEWRNMYVKDYEIGFSLLVYLVAKLTKNLGAVLFIIQALTITPVYIAISRNRKTMPVWLGMLIYYFLFYNSTLNMMRQWIAMAFLLLAMQMLIEKRGGLTVFFTLFGCLFHYSAVIAIPIYAVYWFVWLPHRTRLEHNNFQVKGSTLIVLLFFLVAIAAVMNLHLVLKLMSLVGLDRFSGYLKGEQMRLMVNQIILRLPLLVVFLINWKDMCRSHKATPFFMAMLLMDFVASQLVSVDINAIRIGNYFSVYSMLWLPALCACQRPGVKRSLTAFAISGYAVLYWYYFYIFSLRHETYPYAFASIFGS